MNYKHLPFFLFHHKTWIPHSENPRDRTTQISDMVKDKTTISIELDISSFVNEACPILKGVVATKALDSPVLYLSGIGNSNEVG